MYTLEIFLSVDGCACRFTKWLAMYYGRDGIRANSVSPGGYDPDGSGADSTFNRAYSRRTAIGRMMDNDDIKGAIIFLASEASSYVTGTNLMVDGGWTVH